MTACGIFFFSKIISSKINYIADAFQRNTIAAAKTRENRKNIRIIYTVCTARSLAHAYKHSGNAPCIFKPLSVVPKMRAAHFMAAVVYFSRCYLFILVFFPPQFSYSQMESFVPSTDPALPPRLHFPFCMCRL